jgi:hypothetical protein
MTNNEPEDLSKEERPADLHRVEYKAKWIGSFKLWTSGKTFGYAAAWALLVATAAGAGYGLYWLLVKLGVTGVGAAVLILVVCAAILVGGGAFVWRLSQSK